MTALLAFAGAEPRRASVGTPAIVQALGAQLRSLRDTVAGLEADVYGAPQGQSSGSIGGHVRHCLDHVRALVGADRELTYDSRLRGTPVETDPGAAAAELDRLLRALDGVAVHSLHEPVRLTTLVDRTGPALWITSTLGREIAFVLQHTIHHSAIVAVLLERHGITVTPGFGYAPSTPDGRAEMSSSGAGSAISSACGPREPRAKRDGERERVGVGPHAQ